MLAAAHTVENASSAAPEMKPVLAAVGSATVAVLSQSSDVAAIFYHEAGVVYNNCALYMLLYKQCRGFYCCSIRVVNARSVFQQHHLVVGGVHGLILCNTVLYMYFITVMRSTCTCV